MVFQMRMKDVLYHRADNLLFNGDFENWNLATNGTPISWDNLLQVGIAADRYPYGNSNPASAYQGNYYARIVHGEGFSQNIATTIGEQYEIEFIMWL